MKIAKRVSDLPPGGYAIQNFCDNCNKFMAFNRPSDCRWVVSEDGDTVIACCCSMRCAKEYIQERESE